MESSSTPIVRDFAGRVSIPFKRESAWKVELTSTAISSSSSFNSLQTGKCMESNHVGYRYYKEFFRFNSLQTGKCMESLFIISPSIGVVLSFNSLQTGKCMERSRKYPHQHHQPRFNSLQTGKFMESSGQKAEASLKSLSSFNSLQTGKFMESCLLEWRCPS